MEAATVDADVLELPIAHRLELAQRGHGAVTLAKAAEKVRYAVEFGVLRFPVPARHNGQCYACHLRFLSSSGSAFGPQKTPISGVAAAGEFVVFATIFRGVLPELQHVRRWAWGVEGSV